MNGWEGYKSPGVVSTASSQLTVTYLTQWLKIASGENVRLVTKGTLGANSFYVFKCSRCYDNWHVKGHLFEGTAVPSELQDWVKDHRHICKDLSGLITGVCTKCGWPNAQHVKTFFDPVQGTWVTYAPTPAVSAPQIQVQPAPPTPIESPKTIVVEQATGRKFRK